jgi:uncharacterized protein YjiS (DUF1127 family)
MDVQSAISSPLAQVPRASPADSLRHKHILETIMALSLPGERSLSAATPANPIAAIARWIATAQAARTRRKALQALLELDHAQLDDLGISRDDVMAAVSAPAHAGRMLNTARSLRAHS